MGDYCVCGPVVVEAKDVGVASGIHFHSERCLSGPCALIPGQTDGLLNGGHYPGMQVTRVTPLLKADGFPSFFVLPDVRVVPNKACHFGDCITESEIR